MAKSKTKYNVNSPNTKTEVRDRRNERKILPQTEKEQSRFIRNQRAKEEAYKEEIELPGKDITTDENEEEKKHADSIKIIEEIVSWNSMKRKDFEDIYKRGKENVGLVFDKPWTDEEKTRFIAADRVDMNIPTTFNKVLTLLGYEKNNREQFEAEPQEDTDDLTAEIYNNIFRHIENSDDPAKYDYVKSDIFFDGIVPCFGAHEIYVETNEWGESIIKMRSLPYDEILFDMNFKEYEQKNCSRIQHTYETYLDELMLMHPEQAGLFSRIPEDFGAFSNHELQAKTNEYIWDDKLNKGKKIVRVMRDWKRVTKKVYEVHNISKKEITEYYEESEAKQAVEELKAQANQDMEALMAMAAEEKKAEMLLNSGSTAGPGSAGPGAAVPGNTMIPEITKEELDKYLNEQFIIKENPKSLIQYTKAAGTVILEGPKLLEIDEHPVTLYFSLFVRGKFLTVVDVTRDLPRWINKIFAQVDYNMGTDLKNLKVLFTKMLDEDNNTVEEALDAMTEPGGVIFAKGTPQNGSPVQNVQNNNSNAQYAPILQILMQLFHENYGGQNFQGFEESTGESGVAIKRRQAAAAVVALNYVDNLRRFDEQVGMKLVKYIKKFYTHKLVMKVLGESLEAKILQALEENNMYKKSMYRDGLGWIILNDPANPKNIPISDANLSIVVRKVSSRQDEKEIEFEKLKIIQSLGYSVPVEAFLDNMNLKATRREQLIAADKERKQAEARQSNLLEKKAMLDANLAILNATKPQKQLTEGTANEQQ